MRMIKLKVVMLENEKLVYYLASCATPGMGAVCLISIRLDVT